MNTAGSTLLSPEEVAKVHQKAFRCAFDYLNAHYPPEDSPEWWEKAAKELTEASVSQGEGDLAVQLLAGVYAYIDNERERRKQLLEAMV